MPTSDLDAVLESLTVNLGVAMIYPEKYSLLGGVISLVLRV
jgi:hypothetical protein